MTDQYIITEFALKSLVDENGKTKREVIAHYQVRSHPYNPQAGFCAHRGTHENNLFACFAVEPIMSCSYVRQEGKCPLEASIRQAERGKVLDELTKWCKQQWFEVESDEGETYSVIHVGDILAILEELRQEGKP